MKTKRVNRKYSKEFKEEAVALVTKHDYSASQAAEAVGIDKRLIYSWLNKATNDNNEDALSTDERKELLTLRKEVKNLRMEKEILKKASVNSTGQCNNYTNSLKIRSCCNEIIKTSFFYL